MQATRRRSRIIIVFIIYRLGGADYSLFIFIWAVLSSFWLFTAGTICGHCVAVACPGGLKRASVSASSHPPLTALKYKYFYAIQYYYFEHNIVKTQLVIKSRVKCFT